MWNRNFILLCLILLASGLVTAPIELLFPVYVEDVEKGLGRTVWDAALFRAMPIALGGLFALIGGVLSDRLGRKPTLIFGMTGALVVGIVFVSKQPLVILGILCYQGVASGFRTAGGQSYLISSVKPERLGFAAAVYFLTYTLGGAVGNAIGGELIARLGYRIVGAGAVFAMIALILTALVFLPALPGSPKSGERESFAQALAGYGKMLRRREIRLLLGMRFLPTYHWGTVSLLLPVLIKRAAGVQMAGYFGASRDLFASCCQLLSGRICDAVGARPTAFVATCLVALSAVLIALYTHSTALLYAAGVFSAGAAWSVSVTMPRFIDEFSTVEEKGRGVGITHLAWSSGFLSGHVVGGRLESVHVTLPFIVAAGLVTISAILALQLWLNGAAKRNA
ncbi:MAG: MFS transporter [Candidatus Poribacteria bacterium]|nr:MFS transporter [Candidatus Poribacteria bacterium]